MGHLVAKITEGLTLFHSEKALVRWYVVLCVAERLVGAAIMLVSCVAFSVAMAPYQALIVQSSGAFSMILMLTPGNLGILEGMVSGVAGLLGLSVKGVLLGALLQRATAVVVTFLLGLPASHLLLDPARLSTGLFKRELGKETIA